MKVLVHDYAGHPFQVELSRELARKGHEVTHAWFGADSGPKGRMELLPQDPPQLDFVPITIAQEYSKTNFLKRRKGDIAYGKALEKLVLQVSPDVVISGNTPTEAQEAAVRYCHTSDVAFIYWCQDFYSIAASRLLQKKLPGIGHAIGAWYQYLERRQMRRSAHIVHITDAFCAQTKAWGIPSECVSVIPNWGAIDEIPVLPRDNDWATEQNLGSGTRFLYSGTLALKHNPEHLAALARSLTAPDELIVVSAGVGADHLISMAEELPRMRNLPLQPFDRFAEVLGSADVLLALIERDAGEFSVPSKILSYLCAGRPIVLAAPKENLAARILTETGAGVVVEPEDVEGFVKAARSLQTEPTAATYNGIIGRDYAQENFDLSKVAARFEAAFSKVSKDQLTNPKQRKMQ